MMRNRLLLQALVVTLMGFASHLSYPAPASAAPTSPCGWDRCTGVCGVGNPCDKECNWVCYPPLSHDNCELEAVWYEACLHPI